MRICIDCRMISGRPHGIAAYLRHLLRNLLLIPRCAARGAAWATLWTELLLLSLCLAGLRELRAAIPVWSSLGWLASAIVLAVGLRYTAPISLGATVLGAAAVCLVFLRPAIQAARERHPLEAATER